ncbi:MAG TPA: Uma2 family endonuclease [Ktedonobacteraceae bacterium]|nr:Uma2 family endonuclease [Ktedonobacteraceae bacterium]
MNIHPNAKPLLKKVGGEAQRKGKRPGHSETGGEIQKERAMIERTNNDVDVLYYYYDSHPTEEDLMGHSRPHASLIHYLMEVLSWLFHQQACAIYEDFNFFQTADQYEYPLAPDVAVIKGVVRSPDISWRVGVDGPAPQVIFEIASPKTWVRDLNEKPAAYATMGVQEYYAYDPYQTPLPLSRQKGGRLFGWHRHGRIGQMRRLSLDSNGRLWSPHLESFLVPDGALLRLHDSIGNLRLTKDEAETLRAEAEARRARIFAEKLRSVGIDPEQLI